MGRGLGSVSLVEPVSGRDLEGHAFVSSSVKCSDGPACHWVSHVCERPARRDV